MTTNDVHNRGNVLSDKAIRQLKELPSVIDRQIKYLLNRQGEDPSAGNRLVRIAKTVSQDFPYPSGSVNKYEVKLGRPDFDNTTVGMETPSFTPTRADTTDDKVRIACSLVPRDIPEGTLVYIELHNHKWYILPGSVSGDIIGFDTGGYCRTRDEPKYFIVTIDRIGNDEGPSQQPHDAADFPSEYKVIYRGFSHDRMTGGNAYNVHTWIYRVCDDSFDLNVFIDSNAMITWIDGLPENVGDPNDSWELFTDAPQICGFNILDPSIYNSIGALQAQVDDCLHQNNLYDQFTLVPIPMDWNECNLNLCDERNPAWNVVGREIEVKVTERPCGVSKVEGEDENGNIIVRDTLGSFLYGRSPAEITCRRGVATRVHTEGEYECHWMIIWMDMFDEIQVVSDIIIGTRGIEIERKLIDVWRECDLDDEYIEGNTCEES
tara:strand:- start:14162 stop:15463 length:1302 start_codon:yes stop_codon:yes gene_type:complete